jgi:hypothetical protein
MILQECRSMKYFDYLMLLVFVTAFQMQGAYWEKDSLKLLI